ncbi:MAG TPA: histidinol dehydrogenase [Candidatus Acidoferrales bacterium]|nr:histidinol dehydrogenase [Candidatus Acidoferrales bacterium]
MRIRELTDAAVAGLEAGRRSRDLAAERAAARIVRDVVRRGDRAVADWAFRLDGASLRPRRFWIGESELRRARRGAEPALLRAIRHAARNIRRVAKRQMPRPLTIAVEPGVRVQQIRRPLDSVGCYVPAGRFPLLSTLLMTVVPAQAAGVREIIVACPRPGQDLLAAAHVVGLRRILRIGGAQAIAALAYGTRAIPRVDKIFGPGNRFVTAAKRLVSADCAIDLPAGPTELLVVAVRGNPRFIAADMLAQAEHDPDARSLLVTPSRPLAKLVLAELVEQLTRLSPSSPAHQSLDRSGPIYVTRSLEEAIRFSNRFAPEHLSLPGGETAWLDQIDSAGSVFLGSWTAQPAGDYATGSNHVLPTAGWARARGGLAAADFLRSISVQRLTRSGLARLAPTVAALAASEGLVAHGRAVEVRR